MDGNTFSFIENFNNAKNVSCKFVEELEDNDYVLAPNIIIDIVNFQGKRCLYHESWETMNSWINLDSKDEFSMSFEMFISSEIPDILNIDPVYELESGIFFLRDIEKDNALTFSFHVARPRERGDITTSLKFCKLIQGDKYVIKNIPTNIPLDRWLNIKVVYKNSLLTLSLFDKILEFDVEEHSAGNHYGFFQSNAVTYLSNIIINGGNINTDMFKRDILTGDIVGLIKRDRDIFLKNKDLEKYISKIRINNIYKNCLLGITPSRYQFDITLPENPLLEFGYAVAEEGWKNNNPVHFRIHLKEEGNEEILIFEQTINPAREKEERNWFENKINLSEYKNKKVTISFETYTAGEIRNFNLPFEKTNYGLWVNPRIINQNTVQQEVPNIILVSLDLLNPDHLGFFGYDIYETEISPFLDGFLSQCIVFKNAVAQTNMTVPSHMTLFTSFYPIIHNTFRLWAKIDPSYITLAELLRNNGYNTCAVTGGSTMSGDHGFFKGFNEYYDNYHETFKHFNLNLTETEYSCTKALEWLDKNKYNPFFLFLHTFELHAPYIHEDLLSEDLQKQDKKSLSERDQRRRSVQTYDSGINVLDREIGKFMNELEEVGLLENTCVIFISDHGEDFYYHENMLGDLSILHSHSLYEETIKVLLAVYFPDRYKGGIIKEEQVGLIDIFPTLTEILEIDAPAQIQGESFLSVILEDDEMQSKFRFSENFGRRPPRYKDIQVAVRSEKYKYIYTKELEKMQEHIPVFPDITKELYDLENDPEEKVNLADEERELSRFFQILIDEFLKSPKELESVYKKSTQVQLSPEAMRKLRSLGYIK